MDEGTRLGFHAEANYTSPEDNAVAEAAWFLNPGQKPVFTFTVEEVDPMRLASIRSTVGGVIDRAQVLGAHLYLPERISRCPLGVSPSEERQDIRWAESRRSQP